MDAVESPPHSPKATGRPRRRRRKASPAEIEQSPFRNLGLAIRILRELEGSTQAQLATRSGIGKSQLSKYEGGKELPKLTSLRCILEVLNLRPLGLFQVCDVLDRIQEGAPPGTALLSLQGAASLLSDEETAGFNEILQKFVGLHAQIVKGRVLLGVKTVIQKGQP